MNRRSFITAVLAAAAAPALVRAASLMPVRYRRTGSGLLFADFSRELGRSAVRVGNETIYVSLHTGSPPTELGPEVTYAEYARAKIDVRRLVITHE